MCWRVETTRWTWVSMCAGICRSKPPTPPTVYSEGEELVTYLLIAFTLSVMFSTPQPSKTEISPTQRPVPGLNGPNFSCTDDSFSRLAIMPHAGHRMNDLRASIGIKLYLATGVRPTTELEYITHHNRSYCSSSHVYCKY